MSFYTDSARVFDTTDTLEQLGISGITTDYSESSRQVLAGGKLFTQSGILSSGVIPRSDFPDLIKNLASKKIAGYSRETQIIQLDNSTGQ